MADKLTLKEFGATIKAKYPQYAQYGDEEIATRMLAKYPQYQDRIAPYESPRDLTSRTPGQVASDQAAAVLTGIPKTITGIPEAVKGLYAKVAQRIKEKGSRMLLLPEQQALLGEIGADMVKGMAQPFVTTAQAGGALAAPNIIAQPSAEQMEEAASGAGTLLGGVLIGEGARIAKPMAKSAVRQLQSGVQSSGAAASLDATAAANVAKAIRPTTLEGRAITERIAPELSRRGMAGLTGKGIDKGIASELGKASSRLHNVESRLLQEVRPEYQVPIRPIRAEIGAQIERLSEHPTINAQSIQALKGVLSEFERLPDYTPFDRAVKLRRALDNAIDEAGGFKAAASTADRLTMRVQRGAANLLRRALNDIDPELKIANREYSLYRNAMDVVERRNLGEVGTTGSGLPGRGTLLDDILAGWAGNAIGGTTGAAAFEGINLARQSRGYANVKSRAAQSLADALRPPAPAPRALIGSGGPQLPPVVPKSGPVPMDTRPIVAMGTRAERTGRLLGSGEPPKKPVRGGPPQPPTRPKGGLMDILRDIEGSSGSGSPIPTTQLRKRFRSQEALNQAVREASDKGEVWLHKHDHAQALTPAQRADLGLVEIDGEWYTAVSRK